MIYFARYVRCKSTKIFNLHYHELVAEIEYHEVKIHLMVDDYMLDKVLDKINGITGIVKFGNTKILVDTNDKLPNDITLKNAVIFFITSLYLLKRQIT